MTIDTIEELQKYIKVNSDFDVAYLEPFYQPANTMLKALTGVDADSIADEAYKEHCRRYVAVAALSISKGMQNVKMTSTGFTRYSEFAKNVIAASSDAMKGFSDDLAAYLLLCEEAVLAKLEELKPDGWADSVFSTILSGPITTADEASAYSGVQVSRKEFRASRWKCQQGMYRAERAFGEETMALIGAKGSDVAKVAYSYYCTFLSQIIARADADAAWCMLEDYVIRKFGAAYTGGATNMDGGIGL
jgi:hypothetical protein